MPIYEYRCQGCGHEMEKLQRMSDAPFVDCPACAQPALKKLISAVAFRLKGSGWYETDFKQDGKRNLAGDGEPAKPADDKSSDGSSNKPSAGKSEASEQSSSSKASCSNSSKESAGKSLASTTTPTKN